MKRALILSLLFAAACGGGEALESIDVATTAAQVTTSTSEPEATTTTAIAVVAGFPVTISDAMGEVTLGAKPMAIISLSPTATEMLFAIGAGDQVIAVDSLSNFPTSTPLDEGLSAWSPNIESIIAYAPDLVVISADPGDLVSGLNAAGIPVVTQFAASGISDVYAQIEQLGAVTGNVGAAAELVLSMQTEIDDIVASVPEYLDAPTYYHELDDTLYSVTSETFIGELYALLGLVNIADPADDGSAYGYPQLSAEYLVDADPDFIFLADTKCCSASAESVSAREGWAGLTAVVNGRIVELDDDVASRWGPRIVDYLRVIAESMTGAEVD